MKGLWVPAPKAIAQCTSIVISPVNRTASTAPALRPPLAATRVATARRRGKIGMLKIVPTIRAMRTSAEKYS